jgi:hypothetical protein
MEEVDLQNMPLGRLICHFNGFETSLELMQAVSPYLKVRNRSVFKALK